MLVDNNYKNIKLAVIGCGNWGKNLIRVFNEVGILYAVCDSEPTKTTLFRDRYGIPHLTLDQILNNSEINAVAIATPSVTHFEIAYQCLQVNKHVFIEKPLALRSQSALLLKQTAQKNNLTVMVGHLIQYHSGLTAIKKLYKEGILGNLQYISSRRCNFGKFPSEESVLWDFAPHDISIILSITNQLPTHVLASQSNFFEHSSSDLINLHLEFEHNVQAQVFASWFYPYKEQKLIVVGNQATVILDDSQPWESKLMLFTYPEEWRDGLPRPFPYKPTPVELVPTEPLIAECKHFLQSIIDSSPPLTDIDEGLNVIRVLEAAEMSAALQRKIGLPALPDLVEVLSKKADIAFVAST